MSRTAGLRIGGFVLLAGLLLLWEGLSQAKLVHQVYMPPVSKIASTFLAALQSGELSSTLMASARRFAVGYGLAVGVGMALGILMGYFRTGYFLLEPLVELLRPLPPPAIIPISILFLGIGDEMKVFVITFACFFPVLVNTMHGVAGVDRAMVDTARTFGYGTRDIVRKIILPASLPSVVAGMRISLAIALILTVIAEMVAGNSGIGFFILDSERSFRIPEMYAGIFALAIIGYLLNRLFVLLEARALAWYYAAGSRQ